MKKICLFLSLVFFAAVISCTRCDEFEAPIQTEWLRFSIADRIVGSGITETKSGLIENSSYIIDATGGSISIEEEEWAVDGVEQTKASLKSSLAEGDSLGLFGYNTDSTSIAKTKPNVLYNEPYTVNGDELASSKLVLWKDLKLSNARFYAYWPFGKFTVTDSTAVGVPRIVDFTNSTDISKQIDLIIGKTTDLITVSKRPIIDLSMRHALAALQFRVGFACTVKSISITKVNSVVTIPLASESEKDWSSGTPTTYTISFGASGKIISSPGEYLTDDSQYLMVIPQKFGTKSTAVIKMVYNDGSGDDKTITGSLAGTGWSMGKKITYTLNKSGASTKEEYIYFDLCAGNVILTDTTYSGFVYVNGTKSTVHGSHDGTNKYYVFQSVTNSSVMTKTGGDKVYYQNCGYKDSTDYNNRTNCRIPDYGDLSVTLTNSSNVSWDDAVINHPEPAQLFKEWSNTKKEGNKNYSTLNRILICGNKTNATEFDVTIDHIWSRYFPYNHKATIDSEAPRSAELCDRYGGITIGESNPDIEAASSSDKKKQFKNYYTERVTLRLKNHSVLHRLNYCKPIDSSKPGYLKITSADGDGISKGSLSLFFPTVDSLFTNLRCGLLGAGNYSATRQEGDLGYQQRQLKDFELNGGILNIQMRPFSNSKWGNNAYLMACFGSANSQCDITINGGTITAVSNSTAAAIGGGGGWDDNGGGGNVTINGGNVYAYNYGTRIRNGNAIPSTAIGGGSTNGNDANANYGAVGNVYINGGNVYAYSVGGTAIGAGSSAKHRGGNAQVIIRGGNVTAISASGTIGGKSVTHSTAIGGGRAGTEDGDGGTATVEIWAGNLQSGSVGGGKCDNQTGRIGSADIKVNGGTTSAQFIMAKGAATDPTFNMSNGTIKNSNTSDKTFKKVQNKGGAVYMESGTCNISNGTIEKCSADTAGAIFMKGGTFSMTGGKIAHCTSENDGGAVYIEGGSATVNGGEIYKNIASKGNGGGIYIFGGNFTMTGGKVNNNAADTNPIQVGDTFYGGNGGGIFVSSTESDPQVKLLGGEIIYNAADRNGGGLSVDMSSSGNHKATITIGKEAVADRDTLSPNIRLNSAALSGGGMAVQGKGSNITIYSGTVKGNVSAYVKNEDIRNDGGTVELIGKNDQGKKPQVNVLYNTIKFYANNGSDPEPVEEQRVITSTNSPLRPTANALAFKKEFFHMVCWNTKRDGSGVDYDINGEGATMNITEDVSLYAQWVANQ